MNVRKHFKLWLVTGLLAAGCSSLPGLQVLTGAATGDNADAIVASVDLVMADKTGASDPSLMATADRIEAAANGIDIIEIRQDETTDTFLVNLLIPPPTAGSQEAIAAFNNQVRRAIELTWQGIINESVGSDTLEINVLFTQSITTLDTGPSVLGFVVVNSKIERSDALAYLASGRTVNDFVDLIVEGRLIFESPEETELYRGEPNHPLFLLPSQ